ncbi:MAG: DUF3047 domain-containing protein [Candidatus Methylomirabilales bacterium]
MKQIAERWLRDAGFPVGLLVLCLCLIPGRALWAQEMVIVDFGQEKDRVPQGWELSENEGEADLALINEEGGQVIRLRSNSSSFSIQKDLDIDLKEAPFLVWEWKVTELPQGGNFSKSDTDDQAAQLILAFSWRKFIAYIWDSTAPKGTMADAPSPLFRTIKAVVVQSGEGEEGQWITETRNVAEDYKKLFDDEPDKIVGIRIQINSQHTRSQAEAYWRYVKVKARP